MIIFFSQQHALYVEFGKSFFSHKSVAIESDRTLISKIGYKQIANKTVGLQFKATRANQTFMEQKEAILEVEWKQYWLSKRDQIYRGQLTSGI